MLHTVLVEIVEAENCFNAYSSDVPGVLATGKTVEEAVERYRGMAGDQLREMLDRGEELPAAPVTVVSVAVHVPEVSTRDPGRLAMALKYYRKARHLTQKGLAEQWEVTPETISEWERNRRPIPGTVRCLLDYA